MGWFDDLEAEGGFMGGYGGGLSRGPTADLPQGNNPFAYTNGSLLQPWDKPFVPPKGSGGGYKAPKFSKFNFGDFSYSFRAPAAFGEKFVAPTMDEAKADQGYQFTLRQGQDQLEASAARDGLLRSGGHLKGLIDYGQDAASTQYDKVYGRRASEFDRRIGIHDMNADNALEGGRLGYEIAAGSWDRNYGKARTQYEDERSARAAAAAAGNASRNQSYNRALDEYKMAYDIFQTNQANQFDRLYTLGSMGYGAARDAGSFGSEYARNATDLITGRGNAMAAGQIGSGNAWSGAFGNIGDTVGTLALYGATQPRRVGGGATPAASARRRPLGPM